MSISAALDALMSIAGANWEQKLVTGADTVGGEAEDGFVCPGPEGYFPSPSSCQAYYQCAGGSAHKHTCQAGLAWNVRTWQCDWQENVQCDSSRP